MGDITAQTQQVLDRIDAALTKVGTDKSKLLTAQVWLADMRLFEAALTALLHVVMAEETPSACPCFRKGTKEEKKCYRVLSHVS